MCCHAQRVEWYGLPPPGMEGEFVIFNDKLNCLQKMALKLMNLFFGFVPGFQVVSSYFSYKWRLSNLRCKPGCSCSDGAFFAGRLLMSSSVVLPGLAVFNPTLDRAGD